MSRKDLELHQTLDALMRQEAKDVAAFEAGMRRDARSLHGGAVLRDFAKGLSAKGMHDSFTLGEGNPVITKALIENFDFPFMEEARYLLAMRYLRSGQ
jgi:hypothetical protein